MTGLTYPCVKDDSVYTALRAAEDHLLDLHAGVLLTHGGAVASGFALAITQIHKMLPEGEPTE